MSNTPSVWNQTLLHASATIRQAVQILNDTSLKIVLIIDETGGLVGTISDGDIRRGLLKGLDLNDSIAPIVHRDALAVPLGLNREDVLQLMTSNKIQQIPIVDGSLKVIGLHLWDQISRPKMRSNILVIMEGGKGTRLYPQTENCPKPMLLVAGKPILEHIIDRAKAEGFYHFVLAIHYLGHMVEEYFGNGEALGVKIEYLHEVSPLGTAGGLSLLQPLPNSPFVVTNGDVLTDIHYAELLDFHIEHNANATMAVRMHEWQNPFGVVETSGIELVAYEEKPISRTYINAGVYVLEPSSLNLLAKSEYCDMPNLFSSIQEKGQRVVVYPVHESWLDVGSPGDLAEADKRNLNSSQMGPHD